MAIFLKQIRPRYLTLTLTDDLDIVTKKGFTTTNTHVKYENFITYHSEVSLMLMAFVDKQMDKLGKNYIKHPQPPSPNPSIWGQKNTMKCLLTHSHTTTPLDAPGKQAF